MFEHYKPKVEKPYLYEYKPITQEMVETLSTEELHNLIHENNKALDEIVQRSKEFEESFVDVGAIIFRLIFILPPVTMLIAYILSNILGLNPFYEFLTIMIVLFIGGIWAVSA